MSRCGVASHLRLLCACVAGLINVAAICLVVVGFLHTCARPHHQPRTTWPHRQLVVSTAPPRTPRLPFADPPARLMTLLRVVPMTPLRLECSSCAAARGSSRRRRRRLDRVSSLLRVGWRSRTSPDRWRCRDRPSRRARGGRWSRTRRRSTKGRSPSACRVCRGGSRGVCFGDGNSGGRARRRVGSARRRLGLSTTLVAP